MRVADRLRILEGKGGAVEWARERAAGKGDLIRLETADPSFNTPPHIIEAAKQALEQGYTHYSDFQGLLELREAIADELWHETSVSYDPIREILITGGTAASIYLAIHSIVDRGDKVILTDPTYLAFEPCVLAAGGKVTRVRLVEEARWSIDMDELRHKASNGAKAIIFNSPNNPTGSVLNRKDWEQIAEVAEQYDISIILDMLFDRLMFDGERFYNIVSLPKMKERTILVGGFSKVYSMCGFRIGWLAGNAEIVSLLTRTLHLYTTICANPISQKAAIAALRGSQDWLYEWIREYQRRRDLLVNGLNSIPGISCQLPHGGFFAFPNVSGIENSSYRFCEKLIDETGVVATPGVDFGPQGEGHCRMVFGAASYEELCEALRRMRTCLAA